MPTSQRGNSDFLKISPKRNARVVLVALIVFCGIFVVGYASRLAKKAELETDVAHWEERIAQAKQHRLVLVAERNYVDSDAYIEKKARDELGMAQQGDSLVIVVANTPTPAATPQPDQTSTLKKADVPNWQHWYALFMPQATQP